MDYETRSLSDLASLPPLTVANICFALLALPLFVVALGVFNADVPQTVTIAVHWAIAILVVGVAFWGEGLAWTDIGFRRPAWIDLGYLVVLSVAIILVYSLTQPLVAELGLPVSEGTGGVSTEAGIGVALFWAVTVGIVEEIIYRGYPIERLVAYTESPLIAGVVTWGVFTAAHAINWPLGNLLQTALVAAILTIVYLRRRTLFPVVGAHVLVWVFVVLGQFYG